MELIDTQWDVNTNDLIILIVLMIELIDTQWDVNEEPAEADSYTVQGINRYIVGCKCSENNGVFKWTCELIDTQWDVN